MNLKLKSPSETQNIPQAMPLQIELDDVTVTKISERTATIEIAFEISNPNQRSMIVQNNGLSII